jgi:hypothetical protein
MNVVHPLQDTGVLVLGEQQTSPIMFPFVCPASLFNARMLSWLGNDVSSSCHGIASSFTQKASAEGTPFGDVHKFLADT